MSNLLHTRQRISELLGIFAWQAKAYTGSGNTDFNKVSEDVYDEAWNPPEEKRKRRTKKVAEVIEVPEKTEEQDGLFDL